MDIDSVVAECLIGRRFNPKDIVNETGLKIGTKKDINPNWVSNGSRLSIKHFAGDVYLGYFEDSNVTEQDVRNKVIEIVSNYNGIRQYINYLERMGIIDRVNKRRGL
jgi:hypothetical protein